MRSNNRIVFRRFMRPMLLMLAVCFAFVSVFSLNISAEQGGEYGERSEDYRRWAQSDPRWGSLPMGTSGKTVAQIGCLVTSVTKLLIQSGCKSSSNFDVGTYVTWLNANNGLSSSGNLIWANSSLIVDGFDYCFMDYNCGSSSSSYVQNKIMNYICAGFYMVLAVRNSGHWIAVDNAKSLAHGQVYIMDSRSNTSENADVALANSIYPAVNRICLYTADSGSNPTPNPTPTHTPAPTPTSTPAPTPAPNYIDQCDCEPVSVQARVTAPSATLYTQPCASGNGSSVAGTAPNGSILDFSAQVVNTSGEKWYQVVNEGGQQSFVSLQSVEFAGFVNDLMIAPNDPPSGSLPQGSSYPLRDAVVSRHRITSVTGRLTDQNGSIVKSVTVHPNTRGQFNISSSQINAQLRFGELPAGHYNYELIAEVTADSNMTDQAAVFRAVFVSPFSIGTNALATHTVTFVDSVSGAVIGTQTAAHGFYPVMIDAPVHEGLVFSFWQGAGQRVYADMRITAIYSPETSVLGDADGSGFVNVTDALCVLRFAVGIGSSGINVAAADMNGDGIVNASDALILLRRVIL